MLTIQVTLPTNHPAGAAVFLAGTLNDWQPGDEQYQLTIDDTLGVHVLCLPDPPSKLLYKFTRGSWDTEEVSEQGQPVGNRWWTKEQGVFLRNDHIAGWRDRFGREAELAEQTVFCWQEALPMPGLNRQRRVWIYLPPDYEQTDRQYPVLYMHDAQNLFDRAGSALGTWHVAQTLNQLFAQTGWGCIVVGIEHGGPHRLAEYSPVPHPEHGGGEGQAYLTFLTDTLKPLADRTFRTRTDAANTVMIGSSMGGLISVYAALRHGDMFGKVAAFSPSLWWSDDVYALAAAAPYHFVHKLALLGGEQESGTMLPDLLALYYTLVDNGYYEHKIQLDFYQDGTHTEQFWGRELERAIRWLFSEDLVLMPDEPTVDIDRTAGEMRLLRPFVKAALLNGYGKVIYSIDRDQGNWLPIQSHWHGLFALKCLLPNQRIELKKVIL